MLYHAQLQKTHKHHWHFNTFMSRINYTSCFMLSCKKHIYIIGILTFIIMINTNCIILSCKKTHIHRWYFNIYEQDKYKLYHTQLQKSHIHHWYLNICEQDKYKFYHTQLQKTHIHLWILTFMSMINTSCIVLSCKNTHIHHWHFNIYEQDKYNLHHDSNKACKITPQAEIRIYPGSAHRFTKTGTVSVMFNDS